MKSVQLRDGVIEYREQGAGIPLVFVHGLLVNGYLWRKVVPLLSGKFRCIVPNWPLGSHHRPLNADADLRSPALARMIAEFIETLNLKGAILVGNDTGGALCQIVVTTYPEHVSSLVLTDCDAYDNFFPPMFRPLQWFAPLPGSTFLMSQAMRFKPFRRLPTTFGWLTRYPLPDDALDEYLNPLIQNVGIRRDTQKVILGASSQYTLEAAAKFKNFTRPVLIVWGRDDRFFPLEHAQRLSREFPNARLELVDNAGSFLPEDQPARLAEVMEDFICGLHKAT